MKLQMWLGAVLVALVAGGWVSAGEPCCPSAEPNHLQRPGPAGGWYPYGGGLLRWWNRHCFPCCGGPDDYCRKPLPRVCCPPYPPHYKSGPPESDFPQDCSGPH
jgi:hypothetical protein